MNNAIELMSREPDQGLAIISDLYRLLLDGLSFIALLQC